MELKQLQQIVESNARTIQAMLGAQATDRLRHEEFRTQTEATIARLDEAIQRLVGLNEGVVNLLSSLDENQPTILRRLSGIEGKIDRLLERGNES